MWSRYFTQTGSRIAWLIGQFIVLIICVSYIEYVYFTNILPDKEVKENYTAVNCFLINKRLNTVGHYIHKYRADFLISYNVNGVQYNRWVSGNGLDMSFTKNRTSEENYLAQYDVGGTYTCWFNPENPQISLLILRHNWLATFPLMIPSVIGVITLYYFFKNLFVVLGILKIKTREIIQEKKGKK